VEGGGGGLTVSGVSRNRGGFVKCVAIQKRSGIPVLHDALPVHLVCHKVGYFAPIGTTAPDVCLSQQIPVAADTYLYVAFMHEMGDDCTAHYCYPSGT
jgi:hypothetical protein